jgi:hypothetical protein
MCRLARLHVRHGLHGGLTGRREKPINHEEHEGHEVSGFGFQVLSRAAFMGFLPFRVKLE